MSHYNKQEKQTYKLMFQWTATGIWWESNLKNT